MSKCPVSDQLISLVKYRGRLFVSDKSYDTVMAAIDGLEGIFRGLEYAGDLKALVEEGAPKRKTAKFDGRADKTGERTPRYGSPSARPKARAREPKPTTASSPNVIGDTKNWTGKVLVIHSKLNDKIMDEKDINYVQMTHRAVADPENKPLLETAGMTWVLCTGKDYHVNKTLKILQGVGKAKGVVLPKDADTKIKERYTQNGYRVELDWGKAKEYITVEK